MILVLLNGVYNHFNVAMSCLLLMMILMLRLLLVMIVAMMVVMIVVMMVVMMVVVMVVLVQSSILGPPSSGGLDSVPPIAQSPILSSPMEVEGSLHDSQPKRAGSLSVIGTA